MANKFDYGMGAAAIEYDGEHKYIRITDIDENTHKYIGTTPVSPSGEIDPQYIVQSDDILFARTGASVGKTYLYDESDGLLYFAGFLIRANVNNENNSHFVYSQTLTERYKKWVLATSMRSGQPGINSQEYGTFKFFAPTKKEQDKIAEFLKLLDKKIEKQSNLIDCLKLYKRGVLSNLFNRTLRFNNEANWDKKRIDEVFTERCERCSGNEQLLAVTINNGIQIRDEIDKKDNSSEDKSNYKKVYVGDIAYNTMRMWQGASGYSSFEGIVSPAYTVIFPIETEKQNIVFWSFYFKDRELIKTFQKFSQGLTSDTWNLKFSQMALIRVFVPSYDEQCKIAEFLTSIEKKISYEESSLNQLYKLKRGLLNNMFV